MINLLPPEVKDRRIVRSKVYGLTVFYVVILAILVLSAIALETYNFTLKGALGENESTLNTLKLERKEHADLIAQIAFVEDRVNNAAKFQAKSDWTSLLDEVASATPAPIHLGSITLSTDTSKSQLTLSGDTTDSRSIILFRDRLDLSKLLAGSQITSITNSGSGSDKKSIFTITTEVEAAK